MEMGSDPFSILFGLDGTREDKRELLAHLFPSHGLDPGRAVMIGDRGVDMAAARHHGALALGAAWGCGARGELLEAGAHALCESPRGLPGCVARIRTPQ